MHKYVFICVNLKTSCVHTLVGMCYVCIETGVLLCLQVGVRGCNENIYPGYLEAAMVTA